MGRWKGLKRVTLAIYATAVDTIPNSNTNASVPTFPNALSLAEDATGVTLYDYQLKPIISNLKRLDSAGVANTNAQFLCTDSALIAAIGCTENTNVAVSYELESSKTLN